MEDKGRMPVGVWLRNVQQRSRCLNTWSPVHGVVWRSHGTFKRYSCVGGSIALEWALTVYSLTQSHPPSPLSLCFMPVPTELFLNFSCQPTCCHASPTIMGSRFVTVSPRQLFSLSVFSPGVFIPGTEKQLTHLSS